MPPKKNASIDITSALRRFASQYPAAEEGIACEGTALETSTYKAGKKAFVFLGANDMRLKLGESLTEAARLAAKEPERYKVGAHGWVWVALGAGAPPLELLERWIDESYRLLAGPKLVAMLPERTPERVPAPAKKKGAR